MASSSFWSAKYLNFGGESCDFVPFDSENKHIEENEKPSFTFSRVENKFQNIQGNLMI